MQGEAASDGANLEVYPPEQMLWPYIEGIASAVFGSRSVCSFFADVHHNVAQVAALTDMY